MFSLYGSDLDMKLTVRRLLYIKLFPYPRCVLKAIGLSVISSVVCGIGSARQQFSAVFQVSLLVRNTIRVLNEASCMLTSATGELSVSVLSLFLNYNVKVKRVTQVPKREESHI